MNALPNNVEAGSLDWLELPPISVNDRPTALLYGADRTVTEYVGGKLFLTGIHGDWMHGCSFPFHKAHPFLIIGGNAYNHGVPTWVGRKDDEEYLRENGYPARAIGLPICYLPQRQYQRRSGSLLIMPAHSSHYVSALDDDNQNAALAYIHYISDVSRHFSCAAASLHAECIRRGLWIDEFRAAGIDTLQGASAADLNSLERVRALLSQFEYVTSNVLGSHIPYAAAFGAKVSIAGPYQKWTRQQFMSDPFYAQHPHLLDYVVEENELARASFPFLFVEPRHARQHIDWGRAMIGADNVLPPRELQRLIKGDAMSELLRRANRLIRRTAKRSLQAVGLMKSRHE